MTKNKPKQQRVRRKSKNTKIKPSVTDRIVADQISHVHESLSDDEPLPVISPKLGGALEDKSINNGATVLYTTPHGGEEHIPEIYIKHLKKQLGIEDVKEDISTTIKRVNNKINDLFNDGVVDSYCDAIALIIR